MEEESQDEEFYDDPLEPFFLEPFDEEEEEDELSFELIPPTQDSDDSIVLILSDESSSEEIVEGSETESDESHEEGEESSPELGEPELTSTPNENADELVEFRRRLRSARNNMEGGFNNDEDDTVGGENDQIQEPVAHNSDDENNAEEGGRSPPRKVPKLDTADEAVAGPSKDLNTSKGDDDGSTCNICFDSFTNSGEHRISCLKCGHVFGKNCIEKWLQLNKRCPQCNCKATKKEIRILYVKCLKAVDNTELTKARDELKLEKDRCSKLSLENALNKTKLESCQSKMKQDSLEIERLKEIEARAQRQGSYSNLPQTSSQPLPLASNTDPGRKSCRFIFAKYLEIKEGPCRVSAYNEDLNMLVVSHDMKNNLYPNSCGAIKQINMIEMRTSRSVPIHQKQIRDMAFSLRQTNILLTAALDKKATLFNCNGNVTVQTFPTENPLWSCAWDEVEPNIFYLGTSNGQIISYDIRQPLEPVSTFTVPSGDNTPVVRLKFVPPSYQTNSFNLSGLIIQKLKSVWFCELRGAGSGQEQKFHKLPLDGVFSNMDFEPVSGHILVSSKPSGTNNGLHVVCDLKQYYTEALGSLVATTDIIKTYQGSGREGVKMCRSTIFSPDKGYVYVCANGPSNAANVWDVSMSESPSGQISPAPDIVVDFVRGQVNKTKFMSLVSEKGVRIFEEKFG